MMNPSPLLPRTIWTVAPIVLAVLLLSMAAVFLVTPQRSAETQGMRMAERSAAELAARLEAVVQAAAVLEGGLEGSPVRRVPELLAQSNRNAARSGGAALTFGLRDPAGQWLGLARGAIPPTGEPRFVWTDDSLVLVRGNLPGPGGSWAIAVGFPKPRAGLGVVQDGRLLGPRSEGAVASGRGRGPLSNIDAFVALAPVAGTAAQAVAELPAAPLLAEWNAQRNALLFGALTLLGLLLLFWFGLAAQLRRREGHAQKRLASQMEGQERRALQEVSRFFLGLPVAVYRGELFPDGTVLIAFMSEGVARLTGIDAEEIRVPGRWRDRLDADGQAALETFHRRLLMEGEAVVEYSFRREDGSLVWLRDRARITGIGTHEGADVAGVISDISSERRLGESAAMSSKLATLGKMAASIAHELTQPLGAITLASETALASLPEQGGASGDAARRRVARITQHAGRARQLIDHLRAFGRADSGPLEPVNLADALDGALLLTKPLLQTAGMELITELPADLPLLRGRPVLLEQVLVNLMVNARDAMARLPDDERRLKMHAEVSEDGKTVTLTIEDSGPGFPPGVLDRVFEPFFTTKPMSQGTGLGLSICHGIVTAFGGTIAAHNSASGACFTLTLRTWQPDMTDAEAEPSGWTEST
ncbi:MAG: hypothetical protein JWR10_576 [Rubritepida sp.]|nr:hypothetical protein [Rubritepida sp.]